MREAPAGLRSFRYHGCGERSSSRSRRTKSDRRALDLWRAASSWPSFPFLFRKPLESRPPALSATLARAVSLLRDYRGRELIKFPLQSVTASFMGKPLLA